MYGVRHNLVEEFPEYSRYIEYLKTNDLEFASLLARYDQTDKRIYGYARNQQSTTDAHMEQLKRLRVRLKDILYQRLRTAPLAVGT